MKTPLRLTLTLLAFLCLSAMEPKAEAVIPPPDGGYPNFNTAEGQNALFSLTTGSANTAVGWFSLWGNTDGSFNTGTGAGALLFNTANANTAFGAAALLFNTTGFGNTAVGAAALLNNTLGINNTAVGARALSSNAIINGDTTIGGPSSGNTAVGSDALFNNINGSFNTANGEGALFNNTSGANNTGIGIGALSNNSTGNNNVALGSSAGTAVNAADHVIAIGTSGQDVDNSCFIGQIYTNIQPTVGTDPDLVTINSSGRLGRANVSSRRYKHNIQAMEKASEVLYSLKPVSFRYNKEYDATQTLAFGLIAEEVANVCPNLVGRNPQGQPESVRYEQVNAMLLNEFLKEHEKVEKLEATVAHLATQLQKISARAEMNDSRAQVLANDR